MSDKLQKIIDAVSDLSVIEMAELVKALEEKFGVSAAVQATAASTGNASSGEPTEEQSAFTVILKSTGGNKIAVIKALREINPALGLAEAKGISEKADAVILEAAPKDKAEEAKSKLVAAGAAVELK